MSLYDFQIVFSCCLKQQSRNITNSAALNSDNLSTRISSGVYISLFNRTRTHYSCPRKCFSRFNCITLQQFYRMADIVPRIRAWDLVHWQGNSCRLRRCHSSRDIGVSSSISQVLSRNESFQTVFSNNLTPAVAGSVVPDNCNCFTRGQYVQLLS